MWVGGRKHLSPWVLPFASTAKAPNCMGCYSFTDPSEMKDWVSQVGWLIVDALPTKGIHNRLSVWHRIEKIRQLRLAFQPPCYAVHVLTEHVQYRYLIMYAKKVDHTRWEIQYAACHKRRQNWEIWTMMSKEIANLKPSQIWRKSAIKFKGKSIIRNI